MSNLYLARNPRVAARSLEGEMMIMSGKDSTLFTLNETATILWQSADGRTPWKGSSKNASAPSLKSRPRPRSVMLNILPGSWLTIRFCRFPNNRSRVQCLWRESPDERSS